MSQTTDNHEYYLSQIHQLKQLQKVDDQIYEVKKVLEFAPSEFKELQDNFTKVEMQRNHINDKISHLRDQESRINREMEEEKARLKKSKNKLMATGSEKEFHAGSREIDNIEKRSQPREDERIAVRDELKTQLEQLSGIEEQYIDLKTQVEARKATMESQIKEADPEWFEGYVIKQEEREHEARVVDAFLEEQAGIEEDGGPEADGPAPAPEVAGSDE